MNRLFAGAGAAALLALGAFVAPALAQEGLTVGFSQIGSESGWRAAETSVTKAQAETRNVDLKFADAQQKQENQIKAIRGFIAQGVDAILLAPVVATGWDDVLTEAKEAEIPVVLLDRGIDGPDDLYLNEGGVMKMRPVPAIDVKAKGEAVVCSECGSLMVPNGSCYKCENCGGTSGCS